MSKIAKLVTISLITRVIVEDTATDEQILEVARPKFLNQINSELSENLESIVEDTECPYGTSPEEEIEINWKIPKENSVTLHCVDSETKIYVTEKHKDWCVDNDLIHYDGTKWLYFNHNEYEITKELKF